jgi:hypothetical protein
MAGRYSPAISRKIYGVGIKTLVWLPSRETITARADLVISGAETTTIEVHDYFPAFYFERSWVGRRLDVIAALEMQSEDPEKPFPKVERVVYRHWMMGRRSNPGGTGRQGWYLPWRQRREGLRQEYLYLSSYRVISPAVGDVRREKFAFRRLGI